MLLIRHSIGSRLFFQTDNYEIQPKENKWILTINVPKKEANKILKFKEELNLFDVEVNQKTWYYSSDAAIEYNEETNQIVFTADHKTLYPV